MSAPPTLKLTLPHNFGPEVLRIQKQLKLLGFDLELDSVFGYGTESAVRAFQREHGLDTNGEIDQPTRDALFGFTQPLTRLRLPNYPVINLQKALKEKGFSVEANGLADDQTSGALKEFQRTNNLEATGELNPETADLLFGMS